MSVFTSEVTVGNEVAVDGSAHVQPVSGPLTDAQLRAAVVPVSVSGSVAVSNFPATQPVSGPLTDAQLRATPVPISGTVSTLSALASSSTVAQSAIGTSSVNILAANPNRKKVVIFASKATLYVKLGATASAASFTYALTAANSTLEITGWGGQIDVISTVNANTVTVTELV